LLNHGWVEDDYSIADLSILWYVQCGERILQVTSDMCGKGGTIDSIGNLDLTNTQVYHVKENKFYYHDFMLEDILLKKVRKCLNTK
jgi:hypothetical protein